MIVPAYTPGTWWVAVADGGFVVLPGEVSAETLVGLWSSLREGAGLTELLTDLLRPGIAAVPPFALVDVEGGTVHAVVRGDVVVEVTTDEGVRTITGSRMTTWAEAVLADARRVAVMTPGTAHADLSLAIPVLSGVVRAGALVVDLRGAASTGAERTVVGSEARDRPAPASMPAPQLSVVPPTSEPDDDRQRDGAPGVAGPWAPVRSIRAENVRVPERAARVTEHRDWTARSVQAGDASSDEHLTAGTAPIPLGRVMPRPATPLSELDEDGGQGQDHDGLTVLSSDVVALRRQMPDWAGDAVPSLAVPTPRNPAPAKLVLSTGLVVSLNRPVLLGRAPQVTRVSNNEIPRLVTLASPNQDISRTHAEVRMDGEDVVVTDLRSTNGVLLLRQGAGPQRLHPGEPTVVEPGVVVDLGEGATFLVEAGG